MDWQRRLFGRPRHEPEEFEPLSQAHAAYLRELVRRAGQVDRQRKVFGAERHKYQLNPTVSPEEVARFEAEYHVKLPKEYVFFLTQVGNGGAGPYYGLYPLQKLAMYTEYLDQYTDRDEEGLPAFIDRRMTEQDWREAMERADEAPDDEAYDAVIREVCSGLLVIGTQGCTYDNALMWKGSEQGRIVCFDWNLEPDYGPFFTGLSFLDWYAAFFQEILAGNDVASYGYRSLKSERELVASYPAATTLRERWQILQGLERFRKAEAATVEFLAGLQDPELDGLRTELLFRFDLPCGIAVFETLLAGQNPAGAVDCARGLPEAYRDRFYPRMVELLYHPEVKEKGRLLFFLGDCGCRRAADIAPFAANPENGEENRKIAVYVMGGCPDKEACIPLFAALMRDESWDVALNALQAVSKLPCAELLETYEWMWEKYQGDRIMRNNLLVAFKAQGIIKQ